MNNKKNGELSFQKLGYQNLYRISEYLITERQLEEDIEKMNYLKETPEFLGEIEDSKLIKTSRKINIIPDFNSYDYNLIKLSFIEYKNSKIKKINEFDNIDEIRYNEIISIINSIEKKLDFLANFNLNPIEFDYPRIFRWLINIQYISNFFWTIVLILNYFCWTIVLTYNTFLLITKKCYFSDYISRLFIICCINLAFYFCLDFGTSYFFVLSKDRVFNYITKIISFFMKKRYKIFLNDLDIEKIRGMYDLSVIKHTIWSLKN